MKNLNELFIFIQKNYPMFLTNDVSLSAITGKIVDYVNALIEREKVLINEFEKLKTDTNTTIDDLNKTLTDFINTENENYLTFEQEMLDSLVEYKNETDREITAKSLEVDTALNNIDLEGVVSNYFNTQLTTPYFKNLYNDIVMSVYVLADYSANPSVTYPRAYYYNTGEDVLYYKQDSTVQAVDLIESCFYYFNGHLYVVIEENGKKVLREGSIANG